MMIRIGVHLMKLIRTIIVQRSYHGFRIIGKIRHSKIEDRE
jgi:hypothetical protein